MILGHDTKQNERIRQMARELGFYGHSMSAVKNFIAQYTNIAKPQNWEYVNLSTLLGCGFGGNSFKAATFDGRFVYYIPFSADTFVRYDITQLFSATASWEKMSLSTAQNAAMIDQAFIDACFDGRYVYSNPYASNTFVRFDTRKSFTDSNSWERLNRSTFLGSDYAYLLGVCFDGRYVYYSPGHSDTFIRFDTTLSFTTSTSWEKMSLSTAIKAAPVDGSHIGSCFDGRYVYFTAEVSDTLVRFDTTQPFTNSSAWEVLSLSTAMGYAAGDYQIGNKCVFDGRYVYFGVNNSDTLVRFDTIRSFTHTSAWERVSGSTICGSSSWSNVTHVAFDGRYVYYSEDESLHYVLRYDTTQNFTHTSSWEKMSVSTISNGSIARAMCYDGKYVYLVPGAGETTMRVLACPNREVRS
jgi:hypothetical protein